MEWKMKNKVIGLSIFLTFFNSINIYASDDSFEKEGWEIVNYGSQNYENKDSEKDEFKTKIKAASNTALTIAGGAAMTVLGAGLYFIEKNIEQRSLYFEAGSRAGSYFVGNLYGQGTAIRNMYEQEKNLLNSEKK